MKRAKLVWVLWVIGPIVFIGCLLNHLSDIFPVLPPSAYKSGIAPPSPRVLDEVFRFCTGGGWLIPLPFAVAAIIVTVIGKLGDRTRVQRILKVVLWGIVVVGSALVLLFLMAINRCAPW